MKIVFLCGSLEPGRDGVGDYSRRLAGELIRQGHHVKIISLNDKSVPDQKTEVQTDESIEIETLRLGKNLSWKTRIALAKTYIVEFDPEYLSLQFVPYSFDNKGLPFFLAKRLQFLGEGRKWHIMFHELWVGIPEVNSLKTRITKIIHQRIIRSLIQQISPLKITTSIQTYQRALKNTKNEILPLFGNIPIYSNPNKTETSTNFIILCFGTFSSELVEFEKQIIYLQSVALYLNKRPQLWALGNGGHSKKASLIIAADIFGESNIVDFGALSLREISECFSHANIGISRSNSIFCGKSGSTIAMLEHGLPVILRGNRKQDLEENSIDASYKDQVYFHDDNPKQFKISKKPAKEGLSRVAAMLVEMLNN
jgi:hypothetical protein